MIEFSTRNNSTVPLICFDVSVANGSDRQMAAAIRALSSAANNRPVDYRDCQL